MSKYLKLFETHSAYNTYITGNDKILPNVSFCEDNNEVHYNPWTDPRIIAKFNVTSTSSPTTICYSTSITDFTEIEIDGVVQPSVVSSYTFETIGEHTVKYTLADPTTIGEFDFQSCSGLTSVIIPNSVTTIGVNAFHSCSGLTSVTISNGVTTIEDYAFYGCSNLIKVNSDVNGECIIPNTVTIIDESSFERCSNLTSVIIPTTVTMIARYAFYDCTSLTSVTVQATTPPTLGSSVFTNNASGRKIYVPSASVETYKAATRWSNYASVIEAIA